MPETVTWMWKVPRAPAHSEPLQCVCPAPQPSCKEPAQPRSLLPPAQPRSPASRLFVALLVGS